LTRFRILPYKQGSRSAKALATELGGKVLKLENSKYIAKPDDVVINWGNSHTGIDCNRLLNWGPSTEKCSNKLKFFTQFNGDLDLIPKFWTNKEDIPDEAYPVLARQSLTGHSGAGIRWCNDSSDCVDAPLYTRYIKKSDEYRVHIGKYDLILIQRKARVLSCDNPDWVVRNHANGFIYQRTDVNPPDCVTDVALKVFDSMEGLDFGAVDVIYNKHYDRAWVLEINTAPGLVGSTVKDYANYFTTYFT